jgi:hypothetical protein
MAMKPSLALILLAGAFLAPACKALTPRADTGEAVLEVTTDIMGGQVYPQDGKLLSLRLYENGRFDYDDYPEPGSAGGEFGHVVITRKQASLSKDDVRRLMELAEQPDFQRAEGSYPYPGPPLPDSIIKQTIIYRRGGREKQIAVFNYSPQHPKAHYPASLMILMAEVDELKARAIGKRLW